MSLKARLVQSRTNKVLLNVSTSASPVRKFLDRRLIIVGALVRFWIEAGKAV
jgi:hypothetical protein